MKQYLDKIPALAKNRYFVTGLIFVIWISFFDSYNFIFHYKLKDKKEEFQKELDRLNYEIKINNDFIQQLQNPEFAEKYAREKFLMKKDGEDIFIIEDNWFFFFSTTSSSFCLKLLFLPCAGGRLHFNFAIFHCMDFLGPEASLSFVLTQKKQKVKADIQKLPASFHGLT